MRDELADAIARGGGKDSDWITIGPGFGSIPAGSQVEAVLPEHLHAEDRRGYLAFFVRGLDIGSLVNVLTRPFNSPSPPPLGYFGKLMLDQRSLEWAAKRCKPVPLNGTQEMLDRMLLVLWSALFLDLSLAWSAQRKANLSVEFTAGLANCFVQGLHVGDEPVFGGLCAMCACLLYGMQGGLGSKGAMAWSVVCLPFRSCDFSAW